MCFYYCFCVDIYSIADYSDGSFYSKSGSKKNTTVKSAVGT